MRLTPQHRATYDRDGHVTVPDVFGAPEMEAAIADIEAWGAKTLGRLTTEQRAWYLDAGVRGKDVLRKLDNPVHARPALRALAADPRLVGLAESLIGSGLSVYFSQVFMKPPGGGGPKPVHQDNFYFGPHDPDRLVTAWIALDAATTENGCLMFGDGTHRGPVHPHIAPPGEPYNLQVPSGIAAAQPMTPAPVPRGGVSFHHGGTFHGSGDNNSEHWRRALAIHYIADGNWFETPALAYDDKVLVRVS